MKTKLIKTASGMEVVTAREYAEKLIDCVVKSNFPLHNKETILNIGVALIDEYASQFKPTLLTEDKEGEGQGDAVEFAEWIQKEVEKENIMRSVIVGKYLIFENDDVIIRKTTQELYEQFKITRL